MNVESWRRTPGGGILEEESRRRNHAGQIREESGGICRYLGGTQHPGDTQDLFVLMISVTLPMGLMRTHSDPISTYNDTQEAPRRQPGDYQRHPEARKRHPGGQQGLGSQVCQFIRILQSEMEKTKHSR